MRGRERGEHADGSMEGEGAMRAGLPPDAYGPGGIPARAQAEALRQANMEAPPPAHSGGGGGVYTPPSKAAALARHAANRRRMASIIEAGLQQAVDPALGVDSRKNLWRNSAEWIDNAQCTLYVVTPVHDSAQRPGVGAGEVAYFDTRVDYRTDGATYADDVADGSGLVIPPPDTDGDLSRDGARITFYDPCAQDESTNIRTLLHEVQHDADQHQGRHGVGGRLSRGGRAPSWAFDAYRSEFRAYWFEGPEGSRADSWAMGSSPVSSQLSLIAVDAGPGKVLGDADDIVEGQLTTRLQNGRQEGILRHIISPIRAAGDWLVDGQWSQPYAYVAYYMCTDPAFAQMVNAYVRPDSGNGLNSLRIQMLSDAVAARDPRRIVAACNLLDDADRAYLDDRVLSRPFWEQVGRDLGDRGSARSRAHIEATITSSPIPAVSGDGGWYVVAPGDTLRRVAERVLGDAQLAPEIVAVNPGILTNPDHLRVGSKLRMPLP